MASPQYTNADLNKPTEFGQLAPTPDPTSVSSKPYDGVSQPGDATFDWNHYEDYLKTHADPVAAAKQTLAATAPDAKTLEDAGVKSIQSDPRYQEAINTSPGRAALEEWFSKEAAPTAATIGASIAAPEILTEAAPVVGPALLKAGSTLGGAYEGYKYGGVPGAIAGGAAGYAGTSKGVLGRLGELLGIGAKAVPEGEAAGAGADIAGFDRYAPNTGGARTPPVSTEVPYASSQPVATPTTGWGRTTAGPGANPPSATPPSVEALFQDHPWGQSARNVPSGSDLATATQPQPDMTAWEALDQMRAPGRGDGMPPVSSEAPSGPPSAGGATGAYPSGNTGEGAFSPDLSSIPTSSARGTADVAQGKAISASPAPQPSAPARVLYGPGATTQEGLPAQAGVGKGNSALYDPQTPTAYLQAQYGLATDPAEKEFLARAIRQRSNTRNRTSSPWPPRQTTGQ